MVEHCALGKARDAWRNWKHVLYKDYICKGKEPFSAYTMITNPDWEEFKRERATKKFREKSLMQLELQKKNTHPHRMGVCGYYGKKPIWDKEDQEAVAAGGLPAFSEIKGTRARYFIRARASRNEQGEYYFEKAEDKALYDKMVKLSSEPGRVYRNRGPGDVLHDALETDEPPGRARGIGVNVPHKRAFRLTKDEKQRIRNEKKEVKRQQIVALVRMDLMKELSVHDQRLLS